MTKKAQGRPSLGFRGATMFLGYNTNGFAHHRLEDAIEIIAELGYGGIALTPDVPHYGPLADELADAESWGDLIRGCGFQCVIETGARFLLDPRHKHQPTLLSPDPHGRAKRFLHLNSAATLAAIVGAPFVSFWSGTPAFDDPPSVLMDRLVEECGSLLRLIENGPVRLAFEPEPGMFIDTMDKFAELHARVNHPAFGLTIDVGHLVCNGELPVSKYLTEWKHVLWNVHIEDMKRGVHDHLMFGEGEVDFADVFAGLRAANYTGGVYVELSRHSHDAVNTARKSKQFLDQFMT